jgi:hypothetical protein
LKAAFDSPPTSIRDGVADKASLTGQTEKQRAGRSRAALGSDVGTEHETAHRAHELRDGPPKRSSITVRLSETECAQLRQRAGDAGLTVSGYLRSCTFEVETLRAQVKEALAALRTGGSTANQAAPVPVRRSWLRWVPMPFAHWHRRQRPAEV